jgi:hypothetical protein
MHRGAVFFHPRGRCRGLTGSCGSRLRREAGPRRRGDRDSRGFRVAFRHQVQVPIWSITDLDTWTPVLPSARPSPMPPRLKGRLRGSGAGNCDPAYPTVCIPSPPPALDRSQIPYRDFKGLPPDPHGFDGDHDGIGCDTLGGSGA